MSFADNASASPPSSARIGPAEGVDREAALGLGKTIIFGCAAAVATIGGHDLLACELSQAPRAAGIANATVMARKDIRRMVPDRLPVERREPLYVAVPSRRIILQ